MDELVDVLFSVSPISSSLEGMSLVRKSSSGASELEGPQEVVGLLEMGSDWVDFVDKILNVVNAVGSQRLFDDGVRRKRNSLLVNFTITSLENEFSDGLSGRISEGDVGLNSSENVGWSLIDSDEGSVVDLSQSEYSQDSDDLGVEFVNTSDPDDKGEFGLGWYVDLSWQFSLYKMVCTFLLASISALVALWWAAWCSWALFRASALWALFAYLLFNLNSLRAVAILVSLYSFFFSPSGLGGTTFYPAIFTTIWLIIQIMLDLIIKSK